MQPSKIYAMVGAVAVILIVVLAIVLFRSGSSLTEIALGDVNKCQYVGPNSQMPKSLMVGPCEKYEARQCTLKHSSPFEIKATFPGAVIADNAQIVLKSAGKIVADADACQIGLTCPDNGGKREQSLYWKVGTKLPVDQSEMRIQVVNADSKDLYCVEFPLLVVA